MKKILGEIRDGSFAKKWIEENEDGCPNFLATRQREQSHPDRTARSKTSRDDAVSCSPLLRRDWPTKPATSEK